VAQLIEQLLVKRPAAATVEGDPVSARVVESLHVC
jgi:hypothetical protein